MREYGDKIIFLRQIVPGATDRSYGIHVAQLAGLPKEVISRAGEILDELEGSSASPQEVRRSRKVTSNLCDLARKQRSKSAGDNKENDEENYQMRLF